MPEWVIPVELETGVPLPIKPHEDLPPPGVIGLGANWHHPVYPRSREELKEVSGQALRHLGIEWVDVDDHVSFHHYFDEYMVHEWEFPATEHQRYGMAILRAACYTPATAIEISRAGPSYVAIDEYDRQRYWDSGILKVDQDSSVYDFLKDFTIAQGIESFDGELIVQEFLFGTDTERRYEIANLLLGQAAVTATDGIRATYLKAYKDRLILPSLPAEPQKLIFASRLALGTEKRQRKARTELRVRLANHLGIDEASLAA